MTKESKYQLWPFIKLDEGGYSIPDTLLYGIYKDLYESGKLGVVFYDGGVDSFEEFLKYLKNGKNHFVFVVNAETKSFVFMGWLNGVQGHIAYSHFSGIGSHTYKPEIGRKVLEYWAATGVPAVLIGIISSANDTAIRLAMNLGYKKVGEIPGLCHMKYHYKYVGGVVLYYSIGGAHGGR